MHRRAFIYIFIILASLIALIHAKTSPSSTTMKSRQKKPNASSRKSSVGTNKSSSGKRKSKATKRSRSRGVSSGTSLASGALGGLTSVGSTAIKAGRKTFKSTVDLLAGKHVSLAQIVGKWRLSQEIVLRKGVSVSCPSTFELFKNGSLATSFEDKVYLSTFTFKERNWPRYCTISFEARAFKGPGDAEPVPMMYKGYFKRSIFNSKVILMRGRVFRSSGKMLYVSFSLIHDYCH